MKIVRRLLVTTILLVTAHAAHGMACWESFKNKLSCCSQAQPAPAAPIVVGPRGGLTSDQREKLAQDVAARQPVDYNRSVLEMQAASKRHSAPAAHMQAAHQARPDAAQIQNVLARRIQFTESMEALKAAQKSKSLAQHRSQSAKSHH